MRFGVTGPDAHLSFEGLAEQAFAGRVADAARDAVRSDADGLRPAFEHPPVFGELDAVRPVDPTDPHAAGWTVLVAKDDPRRTEWAAALEPLAEHRGMTGDPLVYPKDAPPADWVDERYLGLANDRRPRYVLLAGDPERLPFALQAHLAAVGASVGRVDFDTVADLTAYVEKVLRLERAADPVPGPATLVAATDAGPRDPTFYSRRFLAEPLAGMIAAQQPFTSTVLAGDEMTKDRLLTQLTGTSPAFVLTASHGYETGPADQRRLNGAIVCARKPQLADMLLTAADVPADLPVAEGSVFFQFACWGYGTPRESSFDHWQLGGAATTTAEAPFVAALPKALLKHPRGPIAFIGHADTAWLHGFDDPDHPLPELGQLYHTRLEPFRTLVTSSVLQRRPTGYSLGDLSSRTALLSVNLADFLDRLQATGRELAQIEQAEQRALADAFIRRNDAMFYMVLGDPAARVRVRTP